MKSRRLAGSPLIMPALVLASATLAVFYVSFANLPSLMQDELVYSLSARKLDFEDRIFANTLFFWIYSSTDVCGPHFYACSKVLGHLFLFLSGIATYLIGARYSSWKWSLSVAISVVLGPSAIFASTFMPETLFGLLMIGAGWFAFREEAVNRRLLLSLLLSFVLLGIASQVKPHALLFALPFLVFAVFRLSSAGIAWSQRLVALFVLPMTMVGTNVFIWWMLTGGNGPMLLGAYAGGLTGATGSTSSAQGSIWSLFESFQILASATGFGILKALQLFIWLIVVFAPLVLVWSRSASRSTWLSKFLLLTFPLGLLIVGAFTTYVTFVSGDDHSGRTLLRYLEWYFPFLCIWVISLGHEDKQSSLVKRYASIFAVIFALVVAFGLDFAPSRVILVDSSALFGLLRNPNFASLFLLLVCISLPLGLIQDKRITHSLAALTLLLIVSLGSNGQMLQRQINGTPIETDFAGQAVREELSASESESLFVVGSDKQLMLAAVFQADLPSYDYGLYEEGTVLRASSIPKDATLVIEGLGVSILENGQLERGTARLSRVTSTGLEVLGTYSTSRD